MRINLTKRANQLCQLLVLSMIVGFTSCATEEAETIDEFLPAETAQKKWPSVKSSYPAKGQYYFIQSKHSGKFLDLKNYGYYGETNVHQWDFTANDNQIWYLENFDGNLRLLSKQNWKSLEVNNGSGYNGANIKVGSKSNSSKQKFKIYTTSGKYEFKIANTGSGRLLDVSNYSEDRGGNIHQWKDHDGNNQKWIFYDIREYTGW